MYFNLSEDMKTAIEYGYLCNLGVNELVVLMAIQSQMETPMDDVTMSTQDISQYTGLDMGLLLGQ